MLLLSIICAILLIGLVVITGAAMQASRRLQAYEKFYEDTLEDVDSVIVMLEQLMKRELLSDNPEIQNLHKVISITYHILTEYRTASEERKEKKEG